MPGIWSKCQVIYLRCLLDNNLIQSGFVTAKNKLLPRLSQKNFTKPPIPRAELDSLDNGVDLLIKIKNILKVEKYYIAVDAMCIIQQLHRAARDGPEIFPPFVSNRLKRILQKIVLDRLIFVKSAKNVADLGTKPIVLEKMSENWFKGPSFIRKNWNLNMRVPSSKIFEKKTF